MSSRGKLAFGLAMALVAANRAAASIDFANPAGLARHKQSVGHRIAYFDQLNCDTAFQFDAGGKLWCGTLTMSDNARVGLLVTGDDTAVNIDGGAYLFDNVIIDGNIPNDKVCVKIAPTGMDAAVASVEIKFLHVSDDRSNDSPAKPLFDIDKCFGAINIYGGVNFYEGMIKVTGGTSTQFPTIRLHNAKFRKGHSPANIFYNPGGTGGSSGYVQYEQLSCCEVDNTTGSVNGGQMFPGFQGQLDLTAGITIKSGGYLYQRGAVTSQPISYPATNRDETIIMSATPTNVNLPAASSVRGIIYNIKNIAATGNVTVVPNGTDTIDGLTAWPIGPGAKVRLVSTGTTWFTL